MDWGDVGSGAFAAVIAAVVAGFVTRIGRKREDRRDWRGNRLDSYSDFLDECYQIFALFDQWSFARREEGVRIADVESVAKPASDKLQDQEKRLRHLRVIASKALFQHMMHVHELEHEVHAHLVMTEVETWPTEGVQVMWRHMEHLHKDLEELNEAVRKELGQE